MAALGTFLLLSTFVVCCYSAVISVVGARRRSRGLIESGIGAFYLVCALMTAASAVMINAFLTNDYTIKYVAHYSDSVQPLFYKITSYWGGLDGSIMFWVFLLSVFGSVAVYVNREQHRELIPTHSGDRTFASRASLEAVANLGDQFIARRMAETVVHNLKIVDVDEKNCGQL